MSHLAPIPDNYECICSNIISCQIQCVNPHWVQEHFRHQPFPFLYFYQPTATFLSQNSLPKWSCAVPLTFKCYGGFLNVKEEILFPSYSLWFHNRASRSIGLLYLSPLLSIKANKQNKSCFWVIASCTLLKQNFGSKINFDVIPVSGALFMYWEKSNEQNVLLVSWGETLSSLKWASSFLMTSCWPSWM